MEILVTIFLTIIAIVAIILIVWILRYTFSKSINGKEYIEQYMSKKYGEDWLEQCMEGLRNPEVRQSIADELKLRR